MNGYVVQLFKGKGVQPWRLRLRSKNGETVATSEGYATKWNAKRAAKKMFPSIPIQDITEV